MRFDGVNPGEHPEYIIVGLGNPGRQYEETRVLANIKQGLFSSVRNVI